MLLLVMHEGNCLFFFMLWEMAVMFKICQVNVMIYLLAGLKFAQIISSMEDFTVVDDLIYVI